MYILTENPEIEPLQVNEDMNEKVTAAMAKLRDRLHLQYALRFPSLASQVRSVLDEAAIEAWVSPFPHLLLPDLVEIKMARLLLPQTKKTEPNWPFAQAA